MNVARTPHHHARHSFSIVLGLLLVFLAPPLTTHAESLDLTAKVNAPLPTSPALITSLSDQQYLDAASIIAMGTCGNGAYVVLYLNTTVSGIGACTDGGFSIQTSLISDANQFQTKVYNHTDNEGPDSAAITVYYKPVRSEPEISTPLVFIVPESVVSSNDTKVTPRELFITYTPQPYRIHQLHESWQGELSIQGGKAPYSTVIDWDDKTQSHDTRSTSDPFLISHTFSKAGSFQPVIYVEDKDGLSRSLQLLIIVAGPAAQNTTPEPAQIPLTPVLVATTLGVAVIGALMVQLGNILGLLAAMIKPSSPKG